jgi:hypothetical protein
MKGGKQPYKSRALARFGNALSEMAVTIQVMEAAAAFVAAPAQQPRL